MKTVQATDLRRTFFETLKRLAYEKDPILIERRGVTIAALVTPEQATSARPAASGRLMVDPRALRDFCDKHRIKALSLFGSALTDRFEEGSDVDVMFESEDASPSYFEQMQMTDELEVLFGRTVDLVSRRAVEESTNPIRKRAIFEGARVILAR
jgi:predicted nucleotidyltransferase